MTNPLCQFGCSFRSCYEGQNQSGSNGQEDRRLFFSLIQLFQHKQLGGYGSSQAGHPGSFSVAALPPLNFSFHLPASNTVFSL